MMPYGTAGTQWVNFMSIDVLMAVVSTSTMPVYKLIYRGFSARLQYLQSISNGDTAVLHWAIDIELTGICYESFTNDVDLKKNPV